MQKVNLLVSEPGLHEEGQTVPAEPDAHVPVDVLAGVLQDEDRLYHKKGRGRDAKKKNLLLHAVFLVLTCQRT